MTHLAMFEEGIILSAYVYYDENALKNYSFGRCFDSSKEASTGVSFSVERKYGEVLNGASYSTGSNIGALPTNKYDTTRWWHLFDYDNDTGQISVVNKFGNTRQEVISDEVWNQLKNGI